MYEMEGPRSARGTGRRSLDDLAAGPPPASKAFALPRSPGTALPERTREWPSLLAALAYV